MQSPWRASLLFLLLVLSAGPAVAGAPEDLERLDQAVRALLATPKTVGRLGVLRGLCIAQDRLKTRSEMVRSLPAGTVAPPPPIGDAELQAKITEAEKDLRFALVVEGPALGIREGVLAHMKGLGYAPVPKIPKNVDVIVRATTAIGDPSSTTELVHVEATMEFVVEDGRTKKEIVRFKEIYRYGGVTEDIARERAVQELHKRVDAKAVDRLDKVIKGRGVPK